MAVFAQPSQQTLWDSVMEFTKSSQVMNTDPGIWAIQLSSSLNSAGVLLPSTELAHLLVSHICWDNNVPITWKFLEKALTILIAPPMLVLALLSARIVPHRKCYPAAYRLYLELLKRHAFSFKSQINGLNYQKIMKYIDDVLYLSKIFGLQASEPGILLVEYVLAIVWQLLDASLDDEGLLDLTPEKKSIWPSGSQDMEIDDHHHEGLHKANTTMSIDIIGEFLQNKVTSKILLLARRNMPSHWGSFMQRLRVLAAKSVALRNSKHVNPETLLQLTSDTERDFSRKYETISKKEFHALMSSGSLVSSTGHSHGASQSALWLPIDMFLEDAMDKSQVTATSAIETLAGLMKALQAVNCTSWHDTFLGLWIAALRLVQRERDSSEGPVPRHDTCLCMLLSIATLAVVNLIEEEESEWIDETERNPNSQRKEKQSSGERRKGLITSLQLLCNYESLLTPLPSVRTLANQAAAKAVMFISGLTSGTGYFESMSVNEMPMNCSGNLRHLLVEACIVRNLLDTSAYLWPGYVNSRSNQVSSGAAGQTPGWSSLLKGSPLTPSLTNTLVATPASSLAEVEKIYELATSGSEDEKIAAATIFCGASLFRGWCIQEHVIIFIISLLSPPVPADYSGTDSHLIAYAPFLNVLLVGISSVDCVQIFSLHGLGPLLTAALLPICEVLGSSPNVSWTLPTGEDISCHAVFSNAFTLLLRLWKFDYPPIEHVKGEVVGSQLSPDYLLSVRNSRVSSFGKSPSDRMKRKRLSKLLSLSREPIFMDSFPRLKLWYRQHQECIASTLSGLEHGTPVHQTVDSLLNMMFKKINRSSQPLTPSASGSSNSTTSGAEDANVRLKVPAWDILEATPFILDAALTACAHGRLSPRELATGLKFLADFLPATLATIVSYFSAEVTRGVWKPVVMNGTDWPSPAANLAIVEQQIKKILAATGVDIPSLTTGGSSPASLPLPLAAFVSHTITYKLDKATERFLCLVGPALKVLASGCPWPCMPIVASLWAQKVKRWSDYFVFSASGTVFFNNSDAVVQLLKSCFTSTLGLSPSHVYGNGGVGALLGHGFGSHLCGGISPVAPGILYVRVHRFIRNTMYTTEQILSLLMFSIRSIAASGLSGNKLEKMKKSKYGMRLGQKSLASSMARVKLAASLAASLVWMSGGLNLVHILIKEMLPSWFLSVHGSEQENGESEGMVATLRGYALAYFAVLCGTFAWGVDLESPVSKRRAGALGAHLEFLVGALDGKITVACNPTTCQAYVSGLFSLMVKCTPNWVLDVDADVLKRLSKGLRQHHEEELALALLGKGGVGAMGAAAELIVDIES